MKKIMAILVLLAGSLSVFAQSEFQPLIIGGVEVPAGSPIAQSTVLVLGKILKASFTCSGTIIGEDIVVTAAHCLGNAGWADLHVYFGTNQNGSGPPYKVVRQEALRLGSDVTGEFDHEDIAILKLEKKIPSGFTPVKILDRSELLQVGTTIIMAGYGRTVAETPGSGNGGVGVLRSVEQNILQVPYGKTEVLIDIRGKGACAGDSGGPAYLKIDNQLYLFGAASRLTDRDIISGSAPKKVYACITDIVYSNLLSHRVWIEATIQSMHQ